MANYYAKARSNHFLVKDLDAFRAEIAPLEIGIVTQREDGRVSIYDDGGDSNGWPAFYYNEDTDEETEVDLPDLIAKHLVDGEVAILQEVGSEKLRYLSGYAVAVNASGETRQVLLSSIIDLARELGPNVTDPSY